MNGYKPKHATGEYVDAMRDIPVQTYHGRHRPGVIRVLELFESKGFEVQWDNVAGRFKATKGGA